MLKYHTVVSHACYVALANCYVAVYCVQTFSSEPHLRLEHYLALTALIFVSGSTNHLPNVPSNNLWERSL